MKGKLTGRIVLLWLAGFFAVVIAVNAYFITISVTTFRGEDEQKPYLQGIEYNQTLERRVAQENLHWTATIAADRLHSGAVRVTVSIRDAVGNAPAAMTLSGVMRHPADEERDRDIRLRSIGSGHYVATVSGISRGSWDVVVQSAARDKPFEAVRRVWVS
ncbi:MAG TPA: FixH family protein [Rhizomicrobium sp.]|nr:FixH family protein [Rhizomicrobium sp.]